MHSSDVKELKRTCKQASSCIPGSKFVDTVFGGYFKKGNRKLYCNLKPGKEKGTRTIKKNKIGDYYIDVGSRDTLRYYDIKGCAEKGLGVKKKKQ